MFTPENYIRSTLVISNSETTDYCIINMKVIFNRLCNLSKIGVFLKEDSTNCILKLSLFKINVAK